MVKKTFNFLLIFLVGWSCTIQSRKDQANYRNLFKQKQWKKAEAFLKDSVIGKDKENSLLYQMELGLLYYEKKHYKKAAQYFSEANETVDRLYTKSIKEALASSIINENSKSFYGSIFERSQLYYYQAMSFYKLAKRGTYYKERTKDGKKELKLVPLDKNKITRNLGRVRSTLIAWDSFFQEMSRLKGIKTFLKHDLLAKITAADLHLALGTKRDKEIAYILLNDGLKILKELGPTQSIFNKKFKEYNADLKERYNKRKSSKGIKSKDLTQEYLKLEEYLQIKILSMAKTLRRGNLKRIARQIEAKQKQINLASKFRNNTTIMFEKDLISELKGKDFSYNLRSAIDGIESPNTRALVNGIGVPIITYFAMGPLGLGFASHHGNVTVYSRHHAGEVLTKEVGIEFELPYAEPSKIQSTHFVQIKQGKELIKEEPLIILSSLSDISFINSQEIIENNFTKRATRVGIKYVVAIIAAYKTYQQVQKSSGELFAKPAALAQFLISQKGIKATEKADVRHWSTLPSYHLKVDLNLKPGSYDVFFIEKKKNETVRNLKSGKLEVTDKEKTFFTHRLL